MGFIYSDLEEGRWLEADQFDERKDAKLRIALRLDHEDVACFIC